MDELGGQLLSFSQEWSPSRIGFARFMPSHEPATLALVDQERTFQFQLFAAANVDVGLTCCRLVDLARSPPFKSGPSHAARVFIPPKPPLQPPSWVPPATGPSPPDPPQSPSPPPPA